MLVLAFSRAILLLVTVGSGAVVAHQSLLPQQHFQEAAKPADAMNMGNETVDLLSKSIQRLLQFNSTEMLRSRNTAAASMYTKTVGPHGNIIITGNVDQTASNFKIHVIATVTVANSASFVGVCITVNGVPCKDSYYCSSDRKQTYFDCRNTPLSKDPCPGTDCNGKCLPKLTSVPSFASGNNSCGYIGLGCTGSKCSFTDMLGDGKAVNFGYDTKTCKATINGGTCKSCGLPKTCKKPSAFLDYVSYDCSNLSTAKGACAKKNCGTCADKTKSLIKDATTVLKKASAEGTTPTNQNFTNVSDVIASASSGVYAKATVPANATPTSATSSVLTSAPSAGVVLVSALAGAVSMAMVM
jgi:hypothetical protein